MSGLSFQTKLVFKPGICSLEMGRLRESGFSRKAEGGGQEGNGGRELRGRAPAVPGGGNRLLPILFNKNSPLGVLADQGNLASRSGLKPALGSNGSLKVRCRMGSSNNFLPSYCFRSSNFVRFSCSTTGGLVGLEFTALAWLGLSIGECGCLGSLRLNSGNLRGGPIDKKNQYIAKPDKHTTPNGVRVRSRDRTRLAKAGAGRECFEDMLGELGWGAKYFGSTSGHQSR